MKLAAFLKNATANRVYRTAATVAGGRRLFCVFGGVMYD